MKQRRIYSSLCLLYFSICLADVHGADQLVLMSPHSDEIQNEFEAAFVSYYRASTGNDVRVEWLDIGGGTSSILRYIKSEFGQSPDGIGIDILFGGGMDPFVDLAERDLCHPYRLSKDLLARLPAQIGGVPLYDSAYRWYGATLAGFGIVYNRRILDILNLPVPKTWSDLGAPDLFSWVGSGDPRKSGSVHMAYELILQAYGWERGWEVITAMGANVRNFGPSGAYAPKEVAMGEVAYGLAIDFYAWAQVEEVGAEYIGFVMPDNMTIVNPDGIAILKGAPNLAVAEAFVHFVMSDAGQKLWFLKKGVSGGPVVVQLNRFTVLPDLYARYKDDAAVTLNPFEWHSDLIYDAARGGERWGVLNDLIGVLVIDSHRSLQAAWKKAMAGGVSQDELSALSAVPISEAEALELAQSWRDPEIRNRTLANWTGFAREKYGSYQVPLSVRIFDFITLIFPLGIAGGLVIYLWRLRST
jgi:ABC-type Fe3+ transport system substrate-binding protein